MPTRGDLHYLGTACPICLRAEIRGREYGAANRAGEAAERTRAITVCKPVFRCVLAFRNLDFLAYRRQP